MTKKSIQLGLTIAAMVLSPLFFGSIDLFWTVTWTIVLSAAALLCLWIPVDSRAQRILNIFVCGCFLYALVAAIQITPGLTGSLNDPIWQSAKDALNIPTSARISARAEVPLSAIGHFLLFTTAIINGFFAGTSRRSSASLLLFARYGVLVCAAYGLFALVFTPDLLLWTTKIAYRNSLTATFVNHNTAATFLSIGVILWLCNTLAKVQSFRLTSFRALLMSRETEGQALRIILSAAATAICLFALFLTGSRGGIIACVSGAVVAMILMLVNRGSLSRRNVVIVIVVCCALASLILFRAGAIVNRGLFDENRWSVYVAAFGSIRQRPWLGTGLGTFPDIFPMLRGDDFYSWGVWDKAHSSIIEIAFEMGVPVALMVAAAAVASLVMLCRAAVKASDRRNQVLAAIAGVAAAGFLHSLVDFSLQIPGYMIIFGILLGCGLANTLRQQAMDHSTSGVSARSPAQLSTESASRTLAS
ncbi:MAG: O-antigen ligase family protein [Xanthobacteraceae bacterium]|nr:O-antigen ligase family protein [Xanthobacteraceae bacterium]